jgi:hypothetical protein
MREITQRRTGICRMAERTGRPDDGEEGGRPMQLLRATAIALPFVALAALVWALSAILAVPR